VDACPGPTPPGETVVFKRTAAAGAGLYRLDSTATTPLVLAGSSSLDDYPRLNATGTDVVFKCDTLSYTEVCRADAADGQHRRMLGPGSGSGFPDWSPDGAKIAFLQSGYLSLMDSSGANRVFLGGAPTYGANGLGWSRDGTRLAYGSLPAGTTRTVTLDTTHAVTVLDASVTDADQVRWSPDGANVLFSRSNWTIWSVPATGGAAQRLVAFQGGSRGFDVGPPGLLFTAEGPGGPGSGNAVWLLQGGPTGPIVRLTAPPAGSDDVNPSFRRNP
jgi:Tol biopolymer transport system component